VIRKGETLIQDLDTWAEKAGPKSTGQWVDHRSAKEVARCWLGAMSPLLPDG
jgi:hypothetical protein